ncbi:MAG: hypothetical protein ACE5JJ_09575 [Nitrospinota bacterium]
MSFRALGALLGAAAFAAALASCAALEPPPAGRPATPSELSRLRVALEARERAVENLQGLAELALQGELEQYNGRAVVVLAREGSFRIEVLDFFGRPALLVAAHRGRLQVYLPGRGRLYWGRAARGAMARWLGVPLSAEEVSAVLRGALPLLGREGSSPLEVESLGDEWHLEVPGTGSRPPQQVWLAGRSFRPRRARIGGAGGVEVRYGKFLAIGGVSVPGTIEVELGAGERSLRLRYLASSLRVNSPLSQGVFALSPPAGVERLPLDAAGAL